MIRTTPSSNAPAPRLSEQRRWLKSLIKKCAGPLTGSFLRLRLRVLVHSSRLWFLSHIIFSHWKCGGDQPSFYFPHIMTSLPFASPADYTTLANNALLQLGIYSCSAGHWLCKCTQWSNCWDLRTKALKVATLPPNLLQTDCLAHSRFPPWHEGLPATLQMRFTLQQELIWKKLSTLGPVWSSDCSRWLPCHK